MTAKESYGRLTGEVKRRNELRAFDCLGVESLKALVLAKRTEIENLNLLILKLKRMHFGQTSEKLSADIAQLELLLEDLEASQAAAGAAADARASCRSPPFIGPSTRVSPVPACSRMFWSQSMLTTFRCTASLRSSDIFGEE